jgi:hypothetical protein
MLGRIKVVLDRHDDQAVGLVADTVSLTASTAARGGAQTS